MHTLASIRIGFFVAHSKWGAVKLINKFQNQIQLVIIDMQKSECCGTEYSELIRNNSLISDLPILHVIYQDNEICKLNVLNAGASAYLTTPNAFDVLHAKVRALIKRNLITKHIHRFKDLYLDTAQRKVYIGPNKIDFTFTEYMIVELLLKNPDKVFSRYEIIDHIFHDEHFVYTRTVDSHIKNIRTKLGRYHTLIKTHIGFGYRVTTAENMAPLMQ
jgi:DNA-binding response OmpR family regulator